MPFASCQEICILVKTSGEQLSLMGGSWELNVNVLCVLCGVEDRQVRFQFVNRICKRMECGSDDNVDDECSVCIDM